MKLKSADPMCGCTCLLCVTGVHCPLCWMSKHRRLLVLLLVPLFMLIGGCASSAWLTDGMYKNSVRTGYGPMTQPGWRHFKPEHDCDVPDCDYCIAKGRRRK